MGHIPAGSTDAVAYSLNGTRSAFTAACHIALGDGMPLDVLRIDTADGHHEFATCMARCGRRRRAREGVAGKGTGRAGNVLCGC